MPRRDRSSPRSEAGRSWCRTSSSWSGANIDAARPTDGECNRSCSLAVPMSLRWAGSDATSDLAGYTVWNYEYPSNELTKVADSTSATTFDKRGKQLGQRLRRRSA